MKKFGISVLCALVAVVSVLLSYYMTTATYEPSLSIEDIYGVACDAGYEGTVADFTELLKTGGREVTSAYIDGAGHLIIAYSDKTTDDVGLVKSESAATESGREVTSAYIDGAGHLIIAYSDSTTDDLGKITADVTDGESSKRGLSRALTSSASVVVKRGDGKWQDGSAVIYKLDRSTGTAYLITNYHVVYDDSITVAAVAPDSNISIYLYGKEYSFYAIPCAYVGGSSSYDVAVLKIENCDLIKNGNGTETLIGNSDEVSVLDTVTAIGNQRGEGIATTVGTVSVDSENRTTGGNYMRYIRIDTPVNSGNSGGGLFDADGKLIGIVTAKAMDVEIDNIAWAIPINRVKMIADNILFYCDGTEEENGKVASLGIGLSPTASSVSYDETADRIVKWEEVTVKAINPGSLAEQSGLTVGDVIKSITVNGTEYEITRAYQPSELTLPARAGDTVVYKVLRGSDTVEVTMTLPDTLNKIP